MYANLIGLHRCAREPVQDEALLAFRCLDRLANDTHDNLVGHLQAQMISRCVVWQQNSNPNCEGTTTENTWLNRKHCSVQPRRMRVIRHVPHAAPEKQESLIGLGLHEWSTVATSTGKSKDPRFPLSQVTIAPRVWSSRRGWRLVHSHKSCLTLRHSTICQRRHYRVQPM